MRRFDADAGVEIAGSWPDEKPLKPFFFGRLEAPGRARRCAKKRRFLRGSKGVLQVRRGEGINAGRNNSVGLLPQPRIIISG